MNAIKLKTLLFLSLIFISLPSEAQFFKRKKNKAKKEQAVVDRDKYAREIKAIDSMLNLGQLETVMDRILKLKATARSEHQTGFYLAALNEQMVVVEKQSEDLEVNMAQWKLLQEEMKSTDPELSLFLDMSAAALLKRFYSTSLYYDRIEDDSSTNPGDWTREKLNRRINFYIDLAMAYAEVTKKSENLDPALTMYKKPDIDLSIKQVVALASIGILNGVSDHDVEEEDLLEVTRWAMASKDSFLKANFTSDVDGHNYHRILELYQVVLSSYHIYFDLERLKFGKENLPSSDDKFIWACYQIAEKQSTDPYSNLALLELANLYRWSDPARALALLDKGLKRHPGFKMNPALLDEERDILRPSLEIQLEKTYTPGKKILAVAGYKNIDKLYVTVYAIDYADYRNASTSRYHETSRPLIDYISEQKVLVPTQVIELPGYSDYTDHSAEFALDSIMQGTHLLVFSSRPDMRDSFAEVRTAIISVAPYVIVDVNGSAPRLLHASDGKPAADVAYKLFQRKDPWSDWLGLNQVKEGYTDKTGMIDMPENKSENNYYLLEIGRQLLVQEISRTIEHNEETPDIVDVKVLTDRSIYRPGQKVFFKCIAWSHNHKKVSEDKDLEVILKDVSGVEKAKLKVTTNKYGSASGTFTLPSAGSTGSYTIWTMSGQAYIQVEEYKRPKYAVSIKEPKVAYKLNDRVDIVGEAMAFAGYPVQGASVSYSVTRRVRMIWDYWKTGYHTGIDYTVVSGDTVTGPDGKFHINFTAAPDHDADPETNPYFVYEVNATVVDLNGEIRSSSYTMTLAYTDVELQVSGEEEYVAGRPAVLPYTYTNLQNQPLPFTGIVQVKRIEREQRIYRSRLWGRADTIAMSKDEFKRWFPDYIKADTTGKLTDVMKVDLKNDKTREIKLPANVIKEAGEYLVIIKTRDGRGAEIQSTYSFFAVPEQAGPYRLANPISIKAIGGFSFQPGQKAKILVGSGADNIMVHLEASSGRGKIYSTDLYLAQSSQLIEIPVLEGDRGNIQINAYGVYNYRIYTQDLTVHVPYSNKELDVRISSFRSDTEPGAREKWKVTIKGPSSERAAIEALAGMYDQSLDDLHNGPYWSFFPYENYYHYYAVGGSVGYNYSGHLKSSYSSAYSYESFRYPSFDPFNLFDAYSGYGKTALYEWSFGDGSIARLGNMSGTYTMTYVTHKNGASMADADGFFFSAGSGKYKSPVGVDFKNEESPSAGKQVIPAIRKNLSETAFFYPNLYANAKGEITLEFTMPEALTKWRMMVLAHSKTMQLGYTEESITTSKRVMIQPNMPRFIRQGDHISIPCKVVNTTDKPLKAKVGILLKDDESNKALEWVKGDKEQVISVPAHGSVSSSFMVDVPEYGGLVNASMYVSADNYSDGEEHMLPVLSMRQLVTESLPVTIRKAGEQKLVFERLKTNNSNTLVHSKLSVEMSSNPAWYAVQSLPYMMEFPHECAEQIFTRLYANSIATHIANTNPEIRRVFEKWQRQAQQGPGFQSRLSANQDLKNTLIEETPWLYDANSQNASMERLGALFNEQKMKNEIETAADKLRQLQMENGAWPWFNGMQANVYITQTIVVGFGKMKAMGQDISAYQGMIEKAMSFLDKEAKRDFDYFRQLKDVMDFYPVDLQYLYCKSYFPELGYKPDNEVPAYFVANAEKSWMRYSMLNQAQLALAIKVLSPQSGVPKLITRSFTESSKRTDEMGMYWPKNTGSCYWYDAPIETQAAIIEAFYQVEGSASPYILEQQVWLLRQKQTQGWGSTRKTADACYVLLMKGELLSGRQDIKVSVDKQALVTVEKEAGTGYFREDVPKEAISNASANISVNAATAGFAYGAVYWQYFEDLDKISKSGSGLSINKRIYKVVNTEHGEEYVEVKPGDMLRVGDIIRVSLSISCDRNLEYVHIKDLRASGTEPMDVISSYHWQDRLGYYQSTRDANTNFYIDNMQKGQYQLNYTLKVEQAGSFSTGIATVQCMYAPEFTANSQSVTLHVE